ncbi:MAG: hypothetical protein ACLP4W_03365 [Mycobacterium sp.]|uniref:hypothetical protein n=1 Tax=Mycobacterium sp. TaxID=1785 RepID=UPI003F94C042
MESYDRDAAAVYSPAEQFEQIGALLPTADAAAKAGVLFSRAGDRRRTVEAAAATAHRLAAVGATSRLPP